MPGVGVNISPQLVAMGQRIIESGLDDALDMAGIRIPSFCPSDRYQYMAGDLTYDKAVELAEYINRKPGYTAKLV